MGDPAQDAEVQNGQKGAIGDFTLRVLERDERSKPQEVIYIDPASPEERRLVEVKNQFINKIPCLLPWGQLDDTVSRGYCPTARLRFYPEIIIGAVHDWIHQPEVMEKAFRSGTEELHYADFERFFQSQRSHPTMAWLVEKHIDSKKPASGVWR